MDIPVGNEPLLDGNPEKTDQQNMVLQAFKTTAGLANLLPTGSVLAFQTLVRIFTVEGKCQTQVSHTLTWILLSLCAFSCFVLCFTDSFRDNKRKVRYGIATFSGLWVIDGSTKVPPENAGEYKMGFIDFIHGFLSVAVFATISVFDQNVVNCFFPKPSEELDEVLSKLPIGVGVLCSLLFGAFPTTRHGIGFPLSKN